MRTHDEIVTLFFDNLPLLTHLLNDFDSPENQLGASLTLLGIQENDLKNIPKLASRIRMLNYKYILAKYFELNIAKDILDDMAICQQALDQAKSIIENSNLFINVQDNLSPYTQGINEIYCRSEFKLVNKNSDVDIMQSVITIADKKAGVEPGFEGITHEDIIIFLLEHFNYDEGKLKDCLEEVKYNFEVLWNKFGSFIPYYMFKNTYELESKKNNQVVPVASKPSKLVISPERVKKTRAIKSIKYKPIADIASWLYVQAKNTNAQELSWASVKECIATDLGRLFGKTHELYLYPGIFANHDWILLLKTKWLTGSTTLGPLHGDPDKKKSYSALRLPKCYQTSAKDPVVKYMSNNHIKQLAAYFIPFIWFNDYDKVGSDGANLMKQKCADSQQEIIGIDYGHLLEKNNTDISYITPDLKLKDEAFSLYKNFTVFMDTQLSERMAGLWILAKIGGIEIPLSTMDYIQRHDPELADKINRIRADEDIYILNDYLNRFSEIAQHGELAKKNYSQYIIANIEEIKSRLVTRRNCILTRFREYIVLDPDALDLSENIRKLLAASNKAGTLLSTDRTLLLNHINVSSAYGNYWTLTQYEIQDSHSYEFQLSCSKADADRWISTINSFLDESSSLIRINYINGQIAIHFKSENLQEICELFDEQNIMKKYYPSTKNLYNTIQRDFKDKFEKDKNISLKKNNATPNTSINNNNNNFSETTTYTEPVVKKTDENISPLGVDSNISDDIMSSAYSSNSIEIEKLLVLFQNISEGKTTIEQIAELALPNQNRWSLTNIWNRNPGPINEEKKNFSNAFNDLFKLYDPLCRDAATFSNKLKPEHLAPIKTVSSYLEKISGGTIAQKTSENSPVRFF